MNKLPTKINYEVIRQAVYDAMYKAIYAIHVEKRVITKSMSNLAYPLTPNENCGMNYLCAYKYDDEIRIQHEFDDKDEDYDFPRVDDRAGAPLTFCCWHVSPYLVSRLRRSASVYEVCDWDEAEIVYDPYGADACVIQFDPCSQESFSVSTADDLLYTAKILCEFRGKNIKKARAALEKIGYRPVKLVVGVVKNQEIIIEELIDFGAEAICDAWGIDYIRGPLSHLKTIDVVWGTLHKGLVDVRFIQPEQAQETAIA